MKLLLLICIVLSSCSPIEKRLEKSRIAKLPKTSEVIQNVDLSGTLYQLGGMLINDHQVIHVTHWPIEIGQPVRLRGIDGVNTNRTVLSKEDLGDDLSVLTLNEPVDLTNHTVITIAKPIIGIPTTVFRFDGRPSIGTVVAGYNSQGRVNLNLAYNMQLLSGDSGKISVQRQNGEIVVVTLNSTASGTGPDLHKLLTAWLENDKFDLASHTSSSILSLLATRNPLTDKQIYSDYTSVDSLTRNTNNFMHNLKGSTGIIAWNSRNYPGYSDGSIIGGAAITKRHIIFTRHASFQDNDTVYFVTKDNTLITRTIVDRADTGYQNWGYGDFRIGLLDSDLPDSIEPLKFLPEWSYEYLVPAFFTGTKYTNKGIYFVYTDQKENSLVGELAKLDFKTFIDPDALSFNQANYGRFYTDLTPNAAVSDWYKAPIGGDSGSPLMFVLGDELVLFGQWTSPNTGPFFGQGRNYNDINRLIKLADSDYGIDTEMQVTLFDLYNHTPYVGKSILLR